MEDDVVERVEPTPDFDYVGFILLPQGAGRLPNRLRSKDAPRSLYRAMQLGLIPEWYMGAAKAILDSYEYPRRPTTSAGSGLNHNDPAWDNVIRAYEEDR